uniref:Mitochondrial import receptor subunit TOM5 homolog n=1 Tax=Nicotiana tabacum TaxID=4097 RepID=A0A1S4CXJ0_TOBAC|nr:PREDICTED: mitochondrial import receptor subunit TOM5 homolog [Nicotiana tabacum]
MLLSLSHYRRASMADSVISGDKIKAFWHSQVHDEEKWNLNMKLLRASALFAGSIILMRQYGDLMAI